MRTWNSRLSIAALALVVAACASSDHSKVESAATTPLRDLNLVRVKIPEVLETAQKEPYARPQDQSCEAMASQIASLDAVLDPDVDAAAKPDPSHVERAEQTAHDEAMGALQRTAEDVVPFRGWVRKLTGAERHSKKVATAIAAGIARRAFLKGVRFAQGCS